MEPTVEKGEDLLSKLPSDVLVSILEKLELREAIRAGVLSSRWQCLPKQLPRFALDIDDFLPGGGDEEYDDHDNGEDDVAPHDDVLSEAGNKMVDVAAALLASRDAGDVRQVASLAVSFHLRHSYYMSLGRLLDDAVASGKVRAVELQITSKMDIIVGIQDGESTERALLHGYGRRFRTLLDACPAAFGALTKLTIQMVKLDKLDLDDILLTCTRLEDLTLKYCVPGPGVLWQVRHARLTDMKISLCGIRGINLGWLPRLERFAFKGWYFAPSHDLVSFGHVPRLSAATLSQDSDETLKLSRILPNTALKDLRLNFRGSNLTDHDCGVAMKSVPWKLDTCFKHYSLTRVTIIGFYNTEEMIVAHIRYLVEAAVNLKEIYMRENATDCAICGHAEPQAGSRFPRTDEEKDTFTKRITNGRSGTFKTYIQS
nr:unnamed protein product [Digitaria exilis]